RPPELPRDLKIDRWAGRYRLLVIATAGTVQRDTISATITLWVPREPTRLQSALVGVTDSNFTFTYGAALAHPTWQREGRTISECEVGVRYADKSGLKPCWFSRNPQRDRRRNRVPLHSPSRGDH